MPSNRDIAEQVAAGLAEFAQLFERELVNADQRGFERAREMAAQLAAKKEYEFGSNLAAAVRAILCEGEDKNAK